MSCCYDYRDGNAADNKALTVVATILRILCSIRRWVGGFVVCVLGVEEIGLFDRGH